MPTSLRWGILGTGWVAGMFTADLRCAGITVSAVGSRSEQSARDFAAKHRIPAAHDSYSGLVADSDVDIIYVATPHPFHEPHALLALNAGKHVMVEKPFAMNARQAQSIRDVARQRGLMALEAMWTRYVPHMRRVDEILAAGTIGEVRTVIADHSQALPADPNHRLRDPNLGGGALLDLGIYPVWLADHVFGAPAHVTATAAWTDTGVDRQCAMVLDYSDGQQALLQCALDTPGPNRAAIMGTRGMISIDPVWHDAASFMVLDNDENIIDRFDGPVEGRGMQFQALAADDFIAERGDGMTDGAAVAGPQMYTADDSVRVMQVMDDIRRCIGLVYPGETDDDAMRSDSVISSTSP